MPFVPRAVLFQSNSLSEVGGMARFTKACVGGPKDRKTRSSKVDAGEALCVARPPLFGLICKGG